VRLDHQAIGLQLTVKLRWQKRELAGVDQVLAERLADGQDRLHPGVHRKPAGALHIVMGGDHLWQPELQADRGGRPGRMAGQGVDQLGPEGKLFQYYAELLRGAGWCNRRWPRGKGLERLRWVIEWVDLGWRFSRPTK